MPVYPSLILLEFELGQEIVFYRNRQRIILDSLDLHSLEQRLIDNGWRKPIARVAAVSQMNLQLVSTSDAIASAVEANLLCRTI